MLFWDSLRFAQTLRASQTVEKLSEIVFAIWAVILKLGLVLLH